mmetsp:Transcript_11831/g.29564  ORF Transcript_11831/g.29564 Transcript_11831/m.29564 type:complete len:233 (+) Transcript_11831:223-921(+)
MASAYHVVCVEDVVALIAQYAADEEARREARARVGARVPVVALLVDKRCALVAPLVQPTPPALDLQLQLAVAGMGAVHDAEQPLRQRLRGTVLAIEPNRSHAVGPGEANVRQVRPCVGRYLECEVRESGVRLLLVVGLVPAHAAQQRHHIEADLLERHRQKRVLLPAIPAAQVVHQLLLHVAPRHRDRLAAHNVDVLEGDRTRVSGHHQRERGEVGLQWGMLEADPVEVVGE